MVTLQPCRIASLAPDQIGPDQIGMDTTKPAITHNGMLQQDLVDHWSNCMALPLANGPYMPLPLQKPQTSDTARFTPSVAGRARSVAPNGAPRPACRNTS